MFVLSVAAGGGVGPSDLELAASALRGAARAPLLWRDAGGRAGFAGGTAGILPEDAFDRQPIASHDMVFAAQARIDNRGEVLEALGVARERWPTLADSDVLCLAYRRWGEDCVQHVTGDFAFAAWHPGDGRLVAAVDAVASVQLFYAATGDRLMAATQLGALLALPQAPRELDLVALGLLAAPKLQAGSTPYRSIRALVGGHVLVFVDGQVRIRQWWRPDTATRLRYRDPRDYVADARELFDRAVAARLRAVGGVATTLSGGLDSSLIAATAARRLQACGGGLTAYTSVPEPRLATLPRPGWDADDGPFAAQVAAMHPNMSHVLVTPGGLSVLDIAPGIHAWSHTPLRNTANHVWISAIAGRAAGAGTRVLLIGEKGNAVLSPNDTWLTDPALAPVRLKLALRLAGSQWRRGEPLDWRSVGRLLVGARTMGIRRRLQGAPPPRLRPGAGLLAPAFREANAATLASFADTEGRAAYEAFVMQPNNAWAADPLPQWGIEYRNPMCDRPLMERILSFPWDGLIIDGRSRGLARAMAEGLTPDSIRFRQARGEQAAEAAATIAAHGEQYRGALDQAARSPAFQAIFDVPAVQDTLDRLLQGVAGREAAQTLDRVLDIGLFLQGAGA